MFRLQLVATAAKLAANMLSVLIARKLVRGLIEVRRMRMRMRISPSASAGDSRLRAASRRPWKTVAGR